MISKLIRKIISYMDSFIYVSFSEAAEILEGETSAFKNFINSQGYIIYRKDYIESNLISALKRSSLRIYRKTEGSSISEIYRVAISEFKREDVWVGDPWEVDGKIKAVISRKPVPYSEIYIRKSDLNNYIKDQFDKTQRYDEFLKALNASGLDEDSKEYEEKKMKLQELEREITTYVVRRLKV